MKAIKYLLILKLLITSLSGIAQEVTEGKGSKSSMRILTIEPGIGIHANFGTDVLISNLVQWSPSRRLSIASYSSFNINNVTQRSFNFIATDYNFSLNQKFGAGATVYSKRVSHTVLMMVGMKYTSFQETLVNPHFNQVSMSINAFSLDYGLMYSLKRGWKKYFLTGRFYLPLHPWLTKGADVENIQGTLHDVALELGIGIKIK